MSKKNRWLKKDFKFCWHPYTQMDKSAKSQPILMEHAAGIKLFDVDGNYYYDTISSWWCNVHGHNHPKINAAIKKQLRTLEHTLFAGVTHQGAVELSEKLIALTPKKLTKVFFSDNGSTAVETALKMSFQYWQNIGKREKTRFIALDAGYHGDTFGAMSVSGIGLFNEVFSPLFFHAFKIPTPNCRHCPAGYYKTTGNHKTANSSPPFCRATAKPRCRLECLKQLETLLKHKNQEIAAVIIEPLVMGAAGMVIYPKEYLIKIARLTKKYGVHLIVDEVATGFGRTGKMFAVDYTRIQPDFMCLSKGLTAGYLPMGATLTTDKIYKTFRAFYHGHTYTANPLACAAALASLTIFKTDKTLAKNQKLITVFHKTLEKFRALAIVKDARALGMIGAIELKEDIGQKVYQVGLKHHLLLRPLGKVIYLWLPLNIKKEELKKILSLTRQALNLCEVL